MVKKMNFIKICLISIWIIITIKNGIFASIGQFPTALSNTLEYSSDKQWLYTVNTSKFFSSTQFGSIGATLVLNNIMSMNGSMMSGSEQQKMKNPTKWTDSQLSTLEMQYLLTARYSIELWQGKEMIPKGKGSVSIAHSIYSKGAYASTGTMILTLVHGWNQFLISEGITLPIYYNSLKPSDSTATLTTPFSYTFINVMADITDDLYVIVNYTQDILSGDLDYTWTPDIEFLENATISFDVGYPLFISASLKNNI